MEQQAAPRQRDARSLWDGLLSSISAFGDSISEAIEPVVDAGVQEGRRVLQPSTEVSAPATPARARWRMVSGMLLGAPSLESRPTVGLLPQPDPSSRALTPSSSDEVPLQVSDSERRAGGTKLHRRSRSRKLKNGSGGEVLRAATVDVGGRSGGSESSGIPVRSGSNPSRDGSDPSRSIVSAMASQTKQLTQELGNARERLAAMEAKCEVLEEENWRLKQAQSLEPKRGHGSESEDGANWEPSEAEEMLREQVEHLLQDKAALEKVKRDLERRNQELMEQVLYYQQRDLELNEYSLSVQDDSAGVILEDILEDSEHSSFSQGASYNALDDLSDYSPLITPAGSAVNLLPVDLSRGLFFLDSAPDGEETGAHKGAGEQMDGRRNGSSEDLLHVTDGGREDRRKEDNLEWGSDALQRHTESMPEGSHEGLMGDGPVQHEALNGKTEEATLEGSSEMEERNTGTKTSNMLEQADRCEHLHPISMTN